MSDLICPYCDKNLGYADDCYDSDETYEWHCRYCDKNFVFTIDYDPCYYESKADCLNGGEHTYEETITIPKDRARLRCTQCGDEKPLEK